MKIFKANTVEELEEAVNLFLESGATPVLSDLSESEYDYKLVIFYKVD